MRLRLTTALPALFSVCACNAGELITLGHSAPAALSATSSEPEAGPAPDPVPAADAGPSPDPTLSPDAGPTDAGTSPGPGPWPPTFSEPMLLTEVNSAAKDDNPTLSSDLLLLCFTSERPSETPEADTQNIWCAERQDPSQPFSAPILAAGLNSTEFESSPALSADGLQIWLGSKREGGQGGVDIWRATRSDRVSEWAAPTLVPELNSTADDIPRPLGGPGGNIMPLGSRRLGSNYRTFLAEWAGASFSEPALVAELGSDTANVVDAFLSADGLVLYFAQTITGEDSGHLYVARRASLDAAFVDMVALDTLNGEFDARDPWLSPDGQELYFSSNRSGDFEIYRARLSAVDAP